MGGVWPLCAYLLCFNSGIEMDKKLQSVRREYLREHLTREILNDDPIAQFQRWLQEAIDAGLQDPTAMTLATVDGEGQPSQRIVLLKDLSADGFVFYTNYESKKAQDMAVNQRVSLHFPWHDLERQVKITGTASKVSARESLAYFVSRPKESQLAAWASAQSRPISSRQLLMQQFNAMKEKFSRGEIPLPDFWGGFRVLPKTIEFWQGGANRLHDRFQYSHNAVGEPWVIQRLAP